MKDARALHDEQTAYWNGIGGGHWVTEQAHTDIMLAPVARALLDHARVKPGDTVIDIGCGCGTTTIELAKRTAPAGRVIGLDVSAPMLGRARELSGGLRQVDYICADAAIHDFSSPFADILFSRFGVMFFGDPTAAFTNLERALKPGGRLVFACWRPFALNPWMQVPLFAAYEHVPRLPKLDPNDPGPYSFADPERVTRILTGAGFAKPRFTPVDLALDIAAGEGLEGAVTQAFAVGATSRAVLDQPAAVRAAVAESIRTALKPHVKGNTVPLGGAIWLVDSE